MNKKESMSCIKGLSPLISTVIIIGIVLAIATFIAPWAFELATSTANTTATETENQIKCQNAGYDFDTSYGTYGANWNFSETGGEDTLSVKISNTGTINLYNFSVEVETNTSEIFDFAINNTYQKTASSPLKPGQSTILHAMINVDINGTLTRVRVLNDVCKHISVKQGV